MKKIGYKIFLSTILGISLLSNSAFAQDKEGIEKEIKQCTNTFIQKEATCPEKWSIKCYEFLINANQQAQACYKNIMIELLIKFYGLSEQDAKNKIDKYSQSHYDENLFLYNDTLYCKQNNCGVSPYLYSEYTTTKEIQIYLTRMLKSIFAHH